MDDKHDISVFFVYFEKGRVAENGLTLFDQVIALGLECPIILEGSGEPFIFSKEDCRWVMNALPVGTAKHMSRRRNRNTQISLR